MSAYREKLLSVNIGASAAPTRKGNINRIEATERKWEKEFAAYRRLRKDGLQPKTTKDADVVEKRAETAAQVEGRPE